MSKQAKTLRKILLGKSDKNLPFADLCGLLSSLGFDERTRGSHHIFSRADVEEIVNLQPLGAKSKAYQVKQVRGIILKYGLASSDDD